MTTRKRKGFTLVEILIVVVILGILAAIVIPQFSSASESAKASSSVSQLQSIRSQLELYQIQHNGAYPDLATDWSQFTAKTDAQGDAGTEFGPYMQQDPANPFNQSTTAAAACAADGSVGWKYSSATGVIEVCVPSTAATKLGWTDTDDSNKNIDIYTPAG